VAVGLDVSEPRIRAVRVDHDGRVLARAERALRNGRLASAVRNALRASRGASGGAGPTGVATLWPGDELPENVSAVLAEDGGGTVTIDAGGAAAIAETWCGAARDCRDAVVLALGQHVTAGALVGGELLRGAHGAAGSVAWLALNPVERDDYRRMGGFEAEVSAAGIVRRLIWRVKAGDSSRVVEDVSGELSRVTAEQVFEAARGGDGVATAVVRDTIRYVGMALANLATILDPECLVVGGRIGRAAAPMLDAIRAECGRHLRPAHAGRLRIVASELGADAAAIGAARAAMLARP
jgi:glucokinase